jgi:hypothetical protein
MTVGAMRVFISYSRRNQQWVRESLVPILDASGVDVVVDYRDMAVALPVIGQMDGLQDSCDSSVLVLSPAYLESDYCAHEMRRAASRRFIPVLLQACAPPDWVMGVVYADLRKDADEAQWECLVSAAGGLLGARATEFLRAVRDLTSLLSRGTSVNLVVREAHNHILRLARPSRAVVEIVSRRLSPPMLVVDLDDGCTENLGGLIAAIMESWGLSPDSASTSPLAHVSKALVRERRGSLALLNFANPTCQFLSSRP